MVEKKNPTREPVGFLLYQGACIVTSLLDAKSDNQVAREGREEEKETIVKGE